MPFKDPEKTRIYQKQWSREQAIENRKKAIEMLGGKCVVCGYNKNIFALQIDHIEPILRTKHHRKWEGGNLTVKGVAKGKIPLSEVQLLCANCYAIKSYEERTKYKNYDKRKRQK